MSQVNPYEYPDPVHQAPSYPPGFYQPEPNFDLMRAIQAPFKSPNWAMNIAWVIGCYILSIVMIGSIILTGYLAEVVEARSGGRKENWPDFNIDRFSDYLMRGLWQFLWYIIWILPIFLVIGIPIGLTGGAVYLITPQGNPQDFSPAAAVVIVVGVVVTIILSLLVSLVCMLSMAHATLSNDFMKGADFSWIFSYIAKMAGVTLLAAIYFIILSMVLNMIGSIACGIGLLITAPLQTLIAADFVAQLHDIFVLRGGESSLKHLGESDVVEAQVLR